jgi:nitrite reductase/ring-hydroxylating ferredoxin subunit
MTENKGQLIALCHLDDLAEGTSRGFKQGNQNVFAIKQGGQVFIYRNACPHLGIPLEWVENQFLDSSGTMIQCANHGAQFVIQSGQCVAGPCPGRSLQSIPHQILDGRIWINPE